MQTPDTEAGRATNAIMRAWRMQNPNAPTSEHNAKWEEVHAALESAPRPPRPLAYEQKAPNAAGILLDLPSKTALLAAQPFRFNDDRPRKH